MKVTFDSNTWRKVVSPNVFHKDPIIADYKIIKESITKKVVVPFISETIFTLEAIEKKGRKQFFREYEPVCSINSNENDAATIKIQISIGPNMEAHPGNDHYRTKHLTDAIESGFNILHLPRIGGIINKDIEEYKYKMTEVMLAEYLKKVFEVSDRITELEAGDYEIKKIAKKYNPNAAFLGIGDAPDSENKLIAKAIAEWADGDSVASHIAIGGDYFCTNDKAVSGGIKSIFSETNLNILKSEYDLVTINPTDLAKILKTKMQQE